jgi:hypothetical protein
MKRGKVLLFGVVAALAILLAFGCTLHFRDDVGGGDWCIKLQIHAPAAGKGITVGDFDVTGLHIRVTDPNSQELQSIDWAAAEGPQTYQIPVAQQGEHRIEVTHIGQRNGEEVRAIESAVFDIRPMVITVIDIVPGGMGMIRVNGEDPNGWLYGYWVQGEGTMGPDSRVLELRANGTLTWWNDYFASREEDIEDYGTWWVEDGTLHAISVLHGGESAIGFTKVSHDEWVLPGLGTLHRRGTEPGGWVFDQTPIPLSDGVWAESELVPLSMDLYKFVAPADGMYGVETRGSDYYPTYTLESVNYEVYAADQRTKLSADWDSDEPTPETVALGAGQVAYVIVDARSEGGTYAIRMLSFP